MSKRGKPVSTRAQVHKSRDERARREWHGQRSANPEHAVLRREQLERAAQDQALCVARERLLRAANAAGRTDLIAAASGTEQSDPAETWSKLEKLLRSAGLLKEEADARGDDGCLP